MQQYRNLDESIAEAFEEIKMWRAKAEKITPSISDLPKGNSGENKIEIAVEHISQLEGKISRDIDRLAYLRESIEKSIDAVPDITFRLLLKYRYIHGMTWEEIAVKMGYNYRWILRLHGRALTQLAIESHIECVL